MNKKKNIKGIKRRGWFTPVQHPFIKKHITADFLIIPTKEETWIGA
jgi:hypothetical protein